MSKKVKKRRINVTSRVIIKRQFTQTSLIDVTPRMWMYSILLAFNPPLTHLVSPLCTIVPPR